MKLKKRYVASGENPKVLCSYGNTPAEAFKQMAKLLEEEKAEWFYAASVGTLDEDFDNFALTVYI
jgi:uncharacterized lipoprotein NlpE involved in copper resistance